MLDVEIPGGDVTTTVSQIRERSPESQVIILSMYEGPQLVQALLAAGICGYLLKSIHWQELVAAIRAIRADKDRVILGVSRESLSDVQPGQPPATLSGRELEVLDLVAQALSNGQIAVSPRPNRGNRQAASAECLRQARRRIAPGRREQGERVATVPQADRGLGPDTARLPAFIEVGAAGVARGPVF